MYEDSIAFPNLHITFEHVGRHINIGSFEIAFYGIVIAIGMLVAFAFILKEGKKDGIASEDITDFFIWAIIIGILGARIYYVIFSWDDYKDDLIQIINLRGGGLAIYGGIIGGFIAICVIAKKKNIPVFKFLDIAALAVLIGQIFGRWGNFFNREVFGGYTNGLFAMQLPVSSVRDQSDINEVMLSNMVTVDDIDTILVHPTFLYESLWNLGAFIILYLFKQKKKADGDIIFGYLGLYGIGRFWIEGMRTDQLKLPAIGVPVSQVVAAVCVVVSIFYFIQSRRILLSKKKGE
ncbi:MAG: prolipoprotein diacylglyceryl transferase [Lachnospiraceae bacterium]|nr:prolipoprotein diacylglyceryl transferase [Lachnospiraceae bacterium]